uniref:LPD7 domain-containing protein n=1 Tax=Aliarcobacter sp. TaxID=2321116 RepID=UPI004048EA9B
MISRVTMRKSGLVQYLKTGHREDSEYSRNDKDNVICLYGNIDILEKAELFTNNYKNWKNNYEHITISFNVEDSKRLDNLGETQRYLALQDIATLMIKHRTKGYDINSEVIAYAEVHQPKIKFENNKERLEHIHICISYLNALNNTKLRTSFYNNSYISDTIDKYIALKHNLTTVTVTNASKKTNTINGTLSKYRLKLKDDLKYINSKDELIEYFNANKINYKEVKTKNNHYFKVINTNMKNINLRGKGFEHLDSSLSGGYLEALKKKNLEELKIILDKYYIDRTNLILKRKSKLLKEKLKTLHTFEEINNVNSISYQQKIFLKHYNHLIKDDLQGYFVAINKDANSKQQEVRITNKKKSIDIVDTGNKISSKTKNSSKDSLEEEVRLMLEIAIAKKWNIANLQIKGDIPFKEEVQRQIALILLENDKLAIKVETEITRPTTPLQELKKQANEKSNNKDIQTNSELSDLKQNLDAKIVLEYVKSKYKLDTNNYVITEDNKINNINNKQKPKNIIDFLQKELNLSSKESIAICKELYLSSTISK